MNPLDPSISGIPTDPENKKPIKKGSLKRKRESEDFGPVKERKVERRTNEGSQKINVQFEGQVVRQKIEKGSSISGRAQKSIESKSELEKLQRIMFNPRVADPSNFVANLTSLEAKNLFSDIAKQGLDTPTLHTFFADIKRASGLSSADIVKIAFESRKEPNIELIWAVIAEEPDFKEKAALFTSSLKVLFEKNMYDKAEWLRNLVGNITPPRSKKSKVGEILTDLKVVYEYTKWSMLGYSPGRLQGLNRQFFQEHVKGDYNFPMVDGSVLCSLSQAQTSLKPILEFVLPDISDDAWLQKCDLDLRLLQYPKVVAFLRSSGMVERLAYMDTPIVFEKNVPVIQLKNRKIALTELVEQCEVRPMFFGPLNSPGIFQKGTDQEWDFLNDDFVPHAKSRDLDCVATVPATGKHTISFMCVDHGNTKTPEGIKRLLSSHAWVQLQEPDGKLYSVGQFGTGQFISPDHYERKDFYKIKVSFDVSEEQFNDIKSDIANRMQGASSDFNVVQKNCSTFAGDIAAQIIGTDRPLATTTVGAHLNFENRIKTFVATRDLAQLMSKKKNEIETFLSTISGQNQFLQLIDFMTNFSGIHSESLEAATGPIFAMLATQDGPSLQAIDAACKDILNILQKPQGEKELHNKLFNLVTDLLDAAKEIPIDHPYTLSLNLQAKKGAHVSKIRPKTRSKT